MALQDKEAMLRAQSAELSRRKAIEAAQSAADLKLHLGMLLSSLWFKLHYPHQREGIAIDTSNPRSS